MALHSGAWSGLWQRLCSSPWLTAIPLGLLAISSALALPFGATYRDAVGFVIDPLLVAVLRVQTIAHPAAGFGAVLNWGGIRYLSTVFYSVYLYQQLGIDPERKLTARWPAISLLATILAVIAMASASYWIVERPFLRLKRRFETGGSGRPQPQ